MAHGGPAGSRRRGGGGGEPAALAHRRFAQWHRGHNTLQLRATQTRAESRRAGSCATQRRRSQHRKSLSQRRRRAVMSVASSPTSLRADGGESAVWHLTRCIEEDDDDTAADAVAHFDGDVNSRGAFGGTPLTWAVVCGKLRTIRALAVCGASVVVEDVFGFSPLCRAAGRETGSLETLLDVYRDADINARECGGCQRAPLHWAADSGSVHNVRVLLDAGVDVYVRDGEGRVPEQVARDGGHTAVAALLVRAQRAMYVRHHTLYSIVALPH